MSVIEGLKEMFSLLDKIADSMSDVITVSKENGAYKKPDVKELMYEDLLQFLLYLAAADCFISDEESEFIEEYLGYSINPQEMKARILRENLKELPDTFPTSFQLFVELDEALVKSGLDKKVTASNALYNLYRSLGKCFINFDGECTDREELQLALYLQILREFRQERLEIGKDLIEDLKDGISGGVALY